VLSISLESPLAAFDPVRRSSWWLLDRRSSLATSFKIFRLIIQEVDNAVYPGPVPLPIQSFSTSEAMRIRREWQDYTRSQRDIAEQLAEMCDIAVTTWTVYNTSDYLPENFSEWETQIRGDFIGEESSIATIIDETLDAKYLACNTQRLTIRLRTRAEFIRPRRGGLAARLLDQCSGCHVISRPFLPIGLHLAGTLGRVTTPV
jgi:hypothetical protein